MAEPEDVGRGETLTAIGSPSAAARKQGPSAHELPTITTERYQSEGEVARGGLGKITAAVDQHIGRRVAIKEIIDPGDVTSDRHRRFVREALVTARLQHPAIVPVYDVGQWPNGAPFFAMKLVNGRPLAKVIDEAKTYADRLALIPHVIAVADAVAYAHERRIIHRDLKPSNVLVGAFGETVVIDWGLAKDLTAESVETDSGLTIEGSIMGTPGYMAPEQATGADVDERADVYAIGAILYHLFSGKPPYDGKSAKEILRLVVIATPTPIAERASELAPDLVAIVDKAMARDPAERYPTAKELAADLKRFQAGQLVAAHRYSTAQKLARFVRRHRAAVTVGTAALLALATVAVVGTRRIVAERDQAEAARARAAAAEARETERADDLTLAHARDLLRRDPSAALSALTTLSPSFSRWGVARTIAADALARDAPRVLRADAPLLGTLSFTPDGKSLLCASDSSSIPRWDVATGAARPLSGHTERVSPIVVTRDGTTLISASYDRTVRVWDLASGSSRVLAKLDGPLGALLLGPDEKRVMLVRDDSSIYDLATGKLLAAVPGFASFVAGTDDLLVLEHDGRLHLGKRELGKLDEVSAIRVTRDGRYAVVAVPKQVIAIELATGTRRTIDLDARFGFVILSPDSRTAALNDGTSTALLWTLDDGHREPLAGHDTPITNVAWSHDGKWLASGEYGGVVRLRDLTGGTSRVLQGHAAAVSGLAFSPDDKLLASASFDRTARLWNVAPAREVVIPADKRGPLLAIGAGGRIHLRTADDGLVVFDAADRSERHLPGPGGLELLSLSPDLHHGITFDRAAKKIYALDLVTGARREVTANVRLDAWSADSRFVALGYEDGTIAIAHADASEPRTLAKPSSAIIGLAFSPDGTRLAGIDEEFEVLMWDVAKGTLRVVGHHQAQAGYARDRNLVWSPDGSMLASGADDQTVGLWTAATDKFTTFRRSGLCLAVAFSPDGKQLASCCGPEGIQIRDLATGTDRMLLGQSDACEEVTWSSDATRIVTAVRDRSVRVWDVASGESRAIQLSDGVLAASFLPDQRSIVAALIREVIVVKDDLPETAKELRAAIASEAAQRHP